MKAIIAIPFSLLFASCMHVGMMGQRDDHEKTAETVVEKEVRSGNLIATAAFPPLHVGKETLFTLRLWDVEKGLPAGRAMVYFHARYSHSMTESDTDHQEAHHTHIDSASTGKQNDIDLNLESLEMPEAGLYSISFTPSHRGLHHLTFHVAQVGDRAMVPELVVEAEVSAVSSHDSPRHSMGGIGSVPSYAIVAITAMAAMMVAVWIVGGRMF